MKISSKEKKNELKVTAEKIHKKVRDMFGDYSRDIDFSFIGLFTTLFYSEMRHDPTNPAWGARDRLIISNLKMLPSLFAVLAESGYINWKECHGMVLQMPRFFSSPNIALVEYPGVEFITQSSCAGMIHALGCAMVGKKSRNQFRVFHTLTDKRSTRLQEALMTASDAKLNNLTAIIPNIDIQRRASIVHFWFSMGWQLEEARFDDISSIFDGLTRAQRNQEKPTILLG